MLHGCCNTGGRAAADAAIDNGTLTEFSTLHIPTNLSRWRNTSAIYEVGFKSGYEPWCIMDRCGVVLCPLFLSHST